MLAVVRFQFAIGCGNAHLERVAGHAPWARRQRGDPAPACRGRSGMSDLREKISAVDSRAAESQLIADLTMDADVRDTNGRLAEELRQFARKLRAQRERSAT